MGDKYGDLATRRIAENPKLLERLKKTVGVEVKMLHIIRNPYDTISTWSRRRKIPIEQIIPKYFKLAKQNERIKEMAGEDVLDIRHEDLIENPKNEIEQAIEFLGLEPNDDYLEACSNIIYKRPNKSREKTSWNEENIEEVAERMKEFPFFNGYGYYS